MSGLFNGNETNSQRAKIPSTVSVKMKSPSDDHFIEYKLDTRIGSSYNYSHYHSFNARRAYVRIVDGESFSM